MRFQCNDTILYTYHFSGDFRKGRQVRVLADVIQSHTYCLNRKT